VKWTTLFVGAVTALSSLGCSSEPSPTELAQQVRQSAKPDEQLKAARKLCDIGLPALPQIRELATDSSLPLPVQLQMMDGIVSAKDWDSMPMLLDFMESDKIEIRSRASGVVMLMLGARFPFPVDGAPQVRREAMKAIRAEYEKINKNPPPDYHSSKRAGS
jgi:hypothetical protein